MNFFSYVEKSKRYKLYILFFVSFTSNLFEILGISLIPAYVFAISSFDQIQNIEMLDFDFLKNIEYSELLYLSSLILVIFFVLKNILTVLFYKIEQKIFSEFVSTNASKLFKFYLNKPYSYFEKINPSEIIKNISISNTQAGEVLISKMSIIKEITLIFFMCSVLMVASAKTTIIILFVLILFSLVLFIFFKKRLVRIGLLAQSNQKEQFQILNNSLNGIREVKIFKIEKIMHKLFNQETKNLVERNNLSGFYIKLPRVFYELLSIFFIVILFNSIVLQNNSLEKSLPILSLYLVSLIRFIPSFTQLNSSINSVNFHSKAEDIILKMLNSIKNEQKIDKGEKINKINFNNEKLELKIENISFAYTSKLQKNIINKLNLEIINGDRICIYGESGVGKSTLIDLIMGLIKPLKGQIKFNKMDINNYNESWSDLIGYVPQNVFVFDDSLIQNIYFKQDISATEKEQLDKVLNQVKLKEFVDNLPQGINTKLGNMGFKLSGGQIQRIGIARALIRKPKIIILDESTNSLDRNTERDILSIFQESEYKNKIVISISHNRQIFNFFSKIFFLKDGNIFEEKI